MQAEQRRNDRDRDPARGCGPWPVGRIVAAAVPLVLVICVLGPAPAAAAAPSVTWDAAVYNPRPAPADWLLPLPCGGALALRAVATPGAEAGYAVSGSFTNGAGTPVLLVSKYELTRRQAQAIRAGVAGSTCPPSEGGGPEAEHPAVLDWVEAIGLADGYSRWLIGQASAWPVCDPGGSGAAPAPCLPSADGVPATVRLPSSLEWEYAARGGLAVGVEVFARAQPADPERIAWIDANAGGRVQPIGTRAADVLGLHDVFGNVSEWVLDAEAADPAAGVPVAVTRGGDAGSAPGDLELQSARVWPLGAWPADARTGVRWMLGVPVFTSVEKVRAGGSADAEGGVAGDGEPAPIAFTGRLRVAVDRAAAVWVDGVRVGEATPAVPFEGEGIAAGERRIGVRGAGYTAEEQVIAVSVHRPGEARFKLRPQTPAEREAELDLDGAARSAIRAELALVGHPAGGGGDAFAESARAALRAFQSAARLEATGYVDEPTRARLAEAGEESRRVREEAERTAREEALVPGSAERAGIRAELGLVGHPAGAGGADFDAAARKALSAFQGAQGLAATGYLDVETRGRLAEAASAEAARRAREAAEREARVPGGAPAMVVMPAGCFRMGSPANEAMRDSDEAPHEVCLDAFAIGKTEVTFAQYDAFCAATGRAKPGEAGWGRGARPVINVSWDDAVAYAAWLSQETGLTYRLPKEAEWEYAARAGTETPFWTGRCIHTDQANYNGTHDYANCGAKTGLYRKQTVPVGSLPANPWGLHEVLGNVWEWTCSEYTESYAGAEQRCADGANRGARALRGGSWYFGPRYLRAALRSWNLPGFRDVILGFRLARTLSP